MEKILAVLTKDIVFGHTLAEYIHNSHALNYKVVSFYEIADYLQYRDENRVSVLLVGEEIGDCQYVTDENKVIILSEEERGEENVIFKYQSLDIIIKRLGFIIREDDEGGNIRNCKLKVRTVLSEKGGSGVTTFALILSSVLGKKQNVLFVSLDPFMTPPPDFEADNGELGELLYSLKLKKANWIDKAHNSIKHGRDFDYISGVLCFDEINSFGPEELRNFLAGLSTDGRYDCVIFDIGSLPPCTDVIIEKSEKIYLVGEDNIRLHNQLKWVYKIETESKIVEVKLPLVKQFQNGLPAYSEFENTELFEFARKLVEKESSGFCGNIGERSLKEEKRMLVAEEKGLISEKKNFMVKFGARL